MLRTTGLFVLLVALLGSSASSLAQGDAASNPPAGPQTVAGGEQPMAMTCTCSKPVRSGAAMAFAGVLLTVLTLAASAAFAGAAVYLFRKSRGLPSG